MGANRRWTSFFIIDSEVGRRFTDASLPFAEEMAKARP
jgi:hypothetical protein